jgi:transcriptional regulator with XRE-family HTH domain
MADELNLTLAGYSKIERGLTDVTVNRLKQIAKIFDISLIDFLESEDSTLNEEGIAYNQINYQNELMKLSSHINTIFNEINNLKNEIESLKSNS